MTLPAWEAVTGSLTYLFGLIADAVIATILAVGGAGLAAVPPAGTLAQWTGLREISRLKRFVLAFATIWLLVMTYGCVSMFVPHDISLGKQETADRLPEFVLSGSQEVQGETVVHGDSAQTYALLEASAETIAQVVDTYKLKGQEFQANTDADRGWTVPDWWPSKECRGGITYMGDVSADPPAMSDFVVNWCPAERRAYVQLFDY